MEMMFFWGFELSYEKKRKKISHSSKALNVNIVEDRKVRE